jgi:gamma-tubulin complex component 2
MMTELEAARDMDELLSCHERFLDTCLKECLLANQELLKVLTKIMTTCLLFSDQMTRFTDAASASNVIGSSSSSSVIGNTRAANQAAREANETGVAWKMRQVRIQARSEHLTSEASHETYVRTIKRFEATFDAQVGEFLEGLWTDSHRHHPQLSNLCVRLDYNGFYSGATRPPVDLNTTKDVHMHVNASGVNTTVNTTHTSANTAFNASHASASGARASS